MNLRRLEEISQNASRPDRGLMIDGWSVGLSPGLARRSRCINAFYASTRSNAENLAVALQAYARANLPCLFRLTPFVSDPTLGPYLETRGYVSFDHTLVQAVHLADVQFGHLQPTTGRVVNQPDLAVAAQWVGEMRGDAPHEIEGLTARWRLSVAQISADFLFDASGERVGRSVSILEDGHVGIFDVGTAAAHRNRGYAGALLAHQLRAAREAGAAIAYLQVSAENPARRNYERFGFRTVYDYHYCALPADAK
jgi:ribosomal protein S18 acetylase RimI-like enzyme